MPDEYNPQPNALFSLPRNGQAQQMQAQPQMAPRAERPVEASDSGSISNVPRVPHDNGEPNTPSEVQFTDAPEPQHAPHVLSAPRAIIAAKSSASLALNEKSMLTRQPSREIHAYGAPEPVRRQSSSGSTMGITEQNKTYDRSRLAAMAMPRSPRMRVEYESTDPIRRISIKDRIMHTIAESAKLNGSHVNSSESSVSVIHMGDFGLDKSSIFGKGSDTNTSKDEDRGKDDDRGKDRDRSDSPDGKADSVKEGADQGGDTGLAKKAHDSHNETRLGLIGEDSETQQEDKPRSDVLVPAIDLAPVAPLARRSSSTASRKKKPISCFYPRAKVWGGSPSDYIEDGTQITGQPNRSQQTPLIYEILYRDAEARTRKLEEVRQRFSMDKDAEVMREMANGTAKLLRHIRSFHLSNPSSFRQRELELAAKRNRWVDKRLEKEAEREVAEMTECTFHPVIKGQTRGNAARAGAGAGARAARRTMSSGSSGAFCSLDSVDDMLASETGSLEISVDSDGQALPPTRRRSPSGSGPDVTIAYLEGARTRLQRLTLAILELDKQEKLQVDNLDDSLDYLTKKHAERHVKRMERLLAVHQPRFTDSMPAMEGLVASPDVPDKAIATEAITASCRKLAQHEIDRKKQVIVTKFAVKRTQLQKELAKATRAMEILKALPLFQEIKRSNTLRTLSASKSCDSLLPTDKTGDYSTIAKFDADHTSSAHSQRVTEAIGDDAFAGDKFDPVLGGIEKLSLEIDKRNSEIDRHSFEIEKHPFETRLAPMPTEKDVHAWVDRLKFSSPEMTPVKPKTESKVDHDAPKSRTSQNPASDLTPKTVGSETRGEGARGQESREEEAVRSRSRSRTRRHTDCLSSEYDPQILPIERYGLLASLGSSPAIESSNPSRNSDPTGTSNLNHSHSHSHSNSHSRSAHTAESTQSVHHNHHFHPGSDFAGTIVHLDEDYIPRHEPPSATSMVDFDASDHSISQHPMLDDNFCEFDSLPGDSPVTGPSETCSLR